MNKLHLLASTTLLAAFLAGCANNPPVPETGEPPVPTPADTLDTASNAVEKMPASAPDNESSNTTKAATDNSNSPQENPQPTATIKLSQKDDQIIAKLSTNWENAKQGDLYLKWVAPKGTTCHNTQLPITKYKDTNDISSAKRPVTSLYTDQACNGIWEVQVITKNGATVANESINIAPTATQTGS